MDMKTFRNEMVRPADGKLPISWTTVLGDNTRAHKSHRQFPKKCRIPVHITNSSLETVNTRGRALCLYNSNSFWIYQLRSTKLFQKRREGYWAGDMPQVVEQVLA
jgi:hypothetical protein